MNSIIPKVFMSYSWVCSDGVIELAERLVNDGVDVILDVWELKEGQDKYAFMERCVTDDTISKVLMICDKSYAEKANSREGGVGDETMVISPEIYAKATETKYLPVIFERDDDGNEFIPAYLKARIYIDLSCDEVYEDGYDKLLRNLFNKPERSKPKLGKMPEWLNEESISLSLVRASIKQIQSYDGKNSAKLQHITKKFCADFIETLISLTPPNDDNFNENLLKQIDATKPLRDLFLDFIEALIVVDSNASSTLGDLFEQAYNKVYRIDGNSYNDSDFEFGLFSIWELFICSVAVLLHFECFIELRELLYRTYFLKGGPLGQSIKSTNFIKFRYRSSYIDNNIKPKSENPQLYCLAADIVSKREKLPVITTNTIANADVVLYQLSEVFNADEQFGRAWFPRLYVYMGGQYEDYQEIWQKMISVRHCEKLFPLFGVDSTEGLKEAVKRNRDDKRKMRYPNSFDSAPTILSNIKIEDIASLP